MPSAVSSHLQGRHPRLLPEEGAEVGRVGEVQFFGDFEDGLLCVLQQGDGFADDGLEHEFLHGVAADGFGQVGQVLGREAELVGIELDAAFATEVLFDEGNEADEGLVLVAHGVAAVDELAAVDAAQAVSQSDEQQFLFERVEQLLPVLQRIV